MSQYLSNIAARSAGNDTNALLPSMPVFNAADSAMAEDFSAENIIPGSAVQDQFVQQSIVPVQPIPLQQVQQATVLNAATTKEQERNREPSYFSKHIKREEAVEENSPVKNNSPETISFKTDSPSQKTAVETVVENVTVKRNEYEQIFIHKTVSKNVTGKKETKEQTGEEKRDEVIETGQVDEIVPVKMQKTNPPVDKQKKNKLLPAISPVEQITPNQPDQLNKRSVQNNKMNDAAPKLVIGKIIVEILPPALPVPQKVITRVVQSSSKDSFSKSNKLIFGLGQL